MKQIIAKWVYNIKHRKAIIMAQTTMQISLKNERHVGFLTITHELPEDLQPFEDWIKKDETLQLTFPSGRAAREAMRIFKNQFPRQRRSTHSDSFLIKGPLGAMPLPGDRSPWGL